MVLDGIRGVSEVDGQKVVSHGSPALLRLTIPMRAILFSLFFVPGDDAEAGNSTAISFYPIRDSSLNTLRSITVTFWVPF